MFYPWLYSTSSLLCFHLLEEFLVILLFMYEEGWSSRTGLIPLRFPCSSSILLPSGLLLDWTHWSACPSSNCPALCWHPVSQNGLQFPFKAASLSPLPPSDPYTRQFAFTLQITNVGEGVGKRKPFYSVAADVSCCSHCENQCGGSSGN